MKNLKQVDKDFFNAFRKTIDDKDQVTWNDVKDGDRVYIPGPIVNGEVTCCYGPHHVVCAYSHKLKNNKNRVFYDNCRILFVNRKPQ